jgi:hypothetical protein
MSHYVYLGATPTSATTSSTATTSALGLNVDELATRIGQRVADRVSTEVARAVDSGVSKITAAVGTGVDRFIDSPAGEAVFDKLESKLDQVAVNTVKKHQTELALLGLAGLALFMGGGSLATKMGPKATTTAFVVGASALALVVTGVFAPPEEAPLPKRRLPR